MTGTTAIEENWRRAGYGENVIRGRLATLFTEVIRAEGLPFGKCDSDVKLQVFDKQLYADLLLWKKGKELKEAACIIELKIPAGWTAVDNELIDNALDKASKSNFQCDYFATSNINEWVLWSTFERKSPLERRKAVFEVARITRPNEIDLPGFELSVKTFASKFLTLLGNLEAKTVPLPEFPIDDFFILLLRSIVNGHSDSLALHLDEHSRTDGAFQAELAKWFVSQGWTAPSLYDDYERVSRQYLYLLLNKVLFYSTLAKGHRKDLKPILVNAETSIQLKRDLQAYFDTAQDVSQDYETIFASNFLETIPLPNEIVPRLTSQINEIARYDFSQLGYRDIGRIFDSLIPPNERHKLGQYYTRDDVVDLVNNLCIRNSRSSVADFGCGAGTFLVRAYARLRQLDPRKTHAQALNQVFGIDISKFASLLSTINLAIRELEYIDNHPLVLCRDFFETFPNESLALMAKSHEGSTLGGSSFTVQVPTLDVVVGNPPYTRREEIEDFIEGYKETLDNAVRRDWREELSVGGKASIYAWFFLHGLRFLRKSGRLGFVTPDSWMDAEYGRYLEQAFLEKTKIVAIIKSGIERWFADAAVNTAITILERCDSAEERGSNFVRFVNLKVPLADLIPPGTDEVSRARIISHLVSAITSPTETVENDQYRVYPVLQRDLLVRGFNPDTGAFQGSAWGSYLRISKNLDRVLKRIGSRLAPLREIARVELGYTTGFNEFFYLEDEALARWKIEERFLTPVLKSPKDIDSIVVPRSASHKYLFSADVPRSDLRGTNALKYIQWGESTGIPSRPFFRGKGTDWYRARSREPPAILHQNLFGDRHLIALNRYKLEIDKKLIGISPNEPEKSTAVCAYLNSTFATLMREIHGRSGLGYGALDVSTRDLEFMPTLDFRQISEDQEDSLKRWFKENEKTDFRSVLDELGAQAPAKFSPGKVVGHRASLDEIVFGILGLEPHERKIVYEQTIQLVDDRFRKATSVETRKPGKRNEAKRLAQVIVESIDRSGVRDFPDGYLTGEAVDVREIPISDDVRIGKDLFAGYFVEIGGEPIPCASRQEADYIRYAALNGHRRVKVTRDKGKLAGMVSTYRKVSEPLLKSIETRASESIPDRRLREEVVGIARRAVFRPHLEAGQVDE
jgi:type I restriction-modification system DNA methylase subunit